MPLKKQGVKTLSRLNLPLSYRADEDGEKFRDIRNAFYNKSKLETRGGYARFNDTALGGSVLSMSFFEKTDGTKFRLAKVGDTLFLVNATGAATSLKTGLTTTTKHHGITLNNRHIIAIGVDGLFSYDGTTFTQLGQDPPAAPSVTNTVAGATLTAGVYTVNLTFFAEGIGFETNAGSDSASVTVSPGDKIAVTSIPTTADNALIDKVRIYVSLAGGADLFSGEVSLGTSTFDVTTDPSTQTPPTTHAKPIAGGGQFLSVFNKQFVYSGNDTFKNDVFFNEQDIPDAQNDTETAVRLQTPGNGKVTGLATGFFNDTELDPFLVIFKRNSTHIYSEISGNARFTEISSKIGCVSHDTIVIRNGSVFFLSTSGWRAIFNGRLVKDGDDVLTLGKGDIDDIFSVSGFVYELNKTQMDNFFGVYYSTLDQYITWTAEGSNTSFDKQYVYQFDVGGFTVYNFGIPGTAAMSGMDSNNEEVVYFSDSSGFVYEHSFQSTRNDVDSNNSSITIDVFALLNWFGGSDDWDATYNFRELIIRAINSSDDVTVRAFINFNQADERLYTYAFPPTSEGFVLDISKLDEGTFGDGRQLVTARADINRTGENILIGFYQNISGANIDLIGAQLHFNKNGNRNLS